MMECRKAVMTIGTVGGALVLAGLAIGTCYLLCRMGVFSWTLAIFAAPNLRECVESRHFMQLDL
jgi:hypothetical protein